MGLFLCAEPDEAFFCPAVFKLGSNPVQTSGNLSPIVGVFIYMKRFQKQRPLVWTEMNRFSGLGWVHACSLFESSVL
jgi:hypothetical protein